MKLLYFYAQKAKEAAKTGTYKEETLIFIKALFEWEHPERSTYQKEAVCIVLIRKNPAKDEKPYQIWLPTYRTIGKEGKNYIYSPNFEYIARVVTSLSEMQKEGKFNIFMAYNTFRQFEGYNRKKTKAFRSQALGVDLDFNKLDRFKSLSYEQSINIIKTEKEDIFKRYSPMIIQSGGGCQLYFLMDKPLILTYTQNGKSYMDNGTADFMEWSQYFNNEFMDYGADPHCKGDTARIYRIPGVYSLKYEDPRLVRLTAQGAKIDPEAIPTLPKPQTARTEPQEAAGKEKKQAKPGRKKSNHCFSNKYVLWYGRNYFNDMLDHRARERAYKNIVTNRIDDLYTAIKQRNYNITGFRNETIFIFSILKAITETDKALVFQEAKKLNNIFTEPLFEDEVKNIVNSVLDNDITIITNESIYKRLYKPLGTDLGALKGKYTPEAKKATERQRKAKAYISKKEYSKEEKMNYIKEHSELSSVQIALDLNCNEKTIRRLRKEIKQAA